MCCLTDNTELEELALYVYLENEIDGESFLELTESDVQKLVKSLGVVKKISKLINSLQIQVKFICMYFFLFYFKV